MANRTEVPRPETIETVVAAFKRTGSIDNTALQTEMSTTKVRKILITEGLWQSPRSVEIRALFDAGKSSQEIAEAVEVLAVVEGAQHIAADEDLARRIEGADDILHPLIVDGGLAPQGGIDHR